METAVRVINLKGNVTLNGLSDVVAELNEAIADKPSVVISFTEARDIDLATIQVILSARKEAESRNGDLSLSGTIDANISDRLRSAGFTSRPVSNGKELEVELFGGDGEHV